MDIILYNTAHRQKELFSPIDKEVVRLYSCWPTVYADPHIGNMRAYVFVDFLKSTLMHVWKYTVDHVMNITDVWHLTDDGDQGEDKMEKWARREKKTVRELARMYEDHFIQYSNALAITPPRIYTRATEYIKAQIDMVHTLIQKWYTYVIPEDGIYMDTSKVENYGKLAQLDFAGMNSDHRGDGSKIDSSKKRNLSDFALRKFSPQDEQRAMEWIFEGPRSGVLLTEWLRDSLDEQEQSTRGFPWWHIECSAMATAELWSKIDIHTWWVDHITVHHTNEIAQAECSLWCSEWVKRWMHVQFLQIDGGKVSKSKWDDLSIPGIVAQWYDALDLRYFYMTGHYRSFLDFTWDALTAAKKSRKNLIKKVASFLREWSVITNQPWTLYIAVHTALADDLDTVKTLSLIHTSLHDGLSSSNISDLLLLDETILKLWLADAAKAYNDKLQLQAPEEIQILAQERFEAKQEKNYTRADELRDAIIDAGWSVKDTADWWTLEKQ